MFEAVPEVDGPRWTIRLEGELDSATVPVLQERLRSALGAKATTLVIDLERLSFIDSTGIEALVVAHRITGSDGDGYEVVFRRPTGDVRRTLSLVGLDTVLPIVES
jgi:anti-anti-sigma factor